MATPVKAGISPGEYLERERAATTKSEYFAGEIFAMSGASFAHTLITSNFVAQLSGQLRKRGCTVHASDLRVKVPATGLYTYPDVVVVCGKPELDDEHRDTVINPILLIAVLSPSTQDYDRGAKFEQYRTITALQEYVLVAQDKVHIEHFARQADGRWLLTETNRLDDQIELAKVGALLRVADVYDNVSFAEWRDILLLWKKESAVGPRHAVHLCLRVSPLRVLLALRSGYAG